MAKKTAPADSTAAATPRTRTNGSRIYIVLEADKPVALINAVSPAQALRHFTGADKYVVRYAEQADLFAAAKANLEVQTSTAAADEPS